MGNAEQCDAWAAADAYELYMGRWSRRLAVAFIERLSAAADLAWVDVGCGTGALSAAILDLSNPASLLAIDPSVAFVEHARTVIHDRRASFAVGAAHGLPAGDGTIDVVASSLAYNFFPDRSSALTEFLRVLKPGGLFAFTVWDYPTGGPAFIDAFWQAAAALDPEAAALDEAVRFQFCSEPSLVEELAGAGLAGVRVEALAIPTSFSDFDDLWVPFTLGAGPAPGYVAGLDPGRVDALRQRLSSDIAERGGVASLRATAWMGRGVRAR
jgi:SAM-dependent methyltransferase